MFFISAYDILSDEQKRKNYDLYGDEKGTPDFDAGQPGDQGGYTYFTSGGPGQGGYSFRPGDWQNMGGQEGSKSFSFSFGGPGSGKQSSHGFGFDDILSNLFGGGMGGGNQFGGGMGGGSQFGGFSRSSGSHNRNKGPTKSIPSVNAQLCKKEIVDNGMTWLLFAYTPNLKGIQSYESVLQEVAALLQGAMKVPCESFSCIELCI